MTMAKLSVGVVPGAAGTSMTGRLPSAAGGSGPSRAAVRFTNVSYAAARAGSPSAGASCPSRGRTDERRALHVRDECAGRGGGEHGVELALQENPGILQPFCRQERESRSARSARELDARALAERLREGRRGRESEA